MLDMLGLLWHILQLREFWWDCFESILESIRSTMGYFGSTLGYVISTLGYVGSTLDYIGYGGSALANIAIVDNFGEF